LADLLVGRVWQASLVIGYSEISTNPCMNTFLASTSQNYSFAKCRPPNFLMYNLMLLYPQISMKKLDEFLQLFLQEKDEKNFGMWLLFI
jgi:hypothetical protein